MSMILAVMYREYRIRTTSLTWLFYDLLVPLIYLLMFGIGLDRAFAGGVTVHGVAYGYNAFFLAGVLSMACFGIAINTSYGFFVDRDNGILYEFLTYPMSRAQFLIGKILFNCVLSVVQAALTLSLGAWLLGIRLEAGWLPADVRGDGRAGPRPGSSFSPASLCASGGTTCSTRSSTSRTSC